MKNKITVSIAGQEYTMVAAEGEDYVRRVAAHVDSQMREVLSQGRLSQADGAVLAAMNIADQYFKEQEAAENLRRQIKDPDYFVRRMLPASARPYRPDLHGEVVMPDDPRARFAGQHH